MEQETSLERALALLPPALRGGGQALPPAVRQAAEEIRLRTGRRPTLLSEGREFPFLEGPTVTGGHLLDVLELATGASVHTAEASIRRGFLTVSGGLRLGLCGTVIPGGDGAPAGLRELSSLAIRLPREVRLCGAGAFDALWRKRFPSTLLLAPPGGGKTTLLREYVRRLSENGVRVALADERGEVAGMWKGRAQFDLGPCTDVLTGAAKAAGALQLLRAMNPQCIAMDEITAGEDVAAVEQIASCGVLLLATAHGSSVCALRSRPLYRRLLELEVFRACVCITGRGAERKYEVVPL